MGYRLNFRGWIIADYNPVTAEAYAKAHLGAIKGNRAHIMASVVSDFAKGGLGVGVVCFGDLHENLDKKLVFKVCFPFKHGEDVVARELAAIRHAFTEGFFRYRIAREARIPLVVGESRSRRSLW